MNARDIAVRLVGDLPPKAVARLYINLLNRFAAHGRAIVAITTNPLGPTIERRPNGSHVVMRFIGFEPLGGIWTLREAAMSVEHGCMCWLGFQNVADAQQVAGQLARRGLRFLETKAEAAA